MVKDQKGVSLVILGVVSVIAVIGLVMMFSTPNKVVGQVYSSATGSDYICPIHTKVGEPQWFPVLAAAGEDYRLAEDFVRAGYNCAVIGKNTNIITDIRNTADLSQAKRHFGLGGDMVDEFGYTTICCQNPEKVPVNPRSEGRITVDTRAESGQPARLGEHDATGW